MTKDAFGAPVQISGETKVSSGGASNISLSEGSAGANICHVGGQPRPRRELEAHGGAQWSAPVATGLAIDGAGNDFVVQGLGAGEFAVAYNKAVTPSTAHEYLSTFNYGALPAAPAKS